MDGTGQRPLAGSPSGRTGLTGKNPWSRVRFPPVYENAEPFARFRRKVPLKLPLALLSFMPRTSAEASSREGLRRGWVSLEGWPLFSLCRVRKGMQQDTLD